MDVMGHVRHEIYLTYIEDARFHLLKLMKQQKDSILAALKIDYLKKVEHPA